MTAPGTRGVGWTYIHGPTLAPDSGSGERARWSDVVLEGHLRRAAQRINPGLPAAAVQRVVDEVKRAASPSVIEDHRAFHELLLSGVPVSYRDADDEERHAHVRLVDFEDLCKNEFVAVNQLTIIVGEHNRRPDIILYINGLPLGEIEAKAPGWTRFPRKRSTRSPTTSTRSRRCTGSSRSSVSPTS